MLDRTTPPSVATFSDITLHPEEIITLPNSAELHIVNKGSLPLSRLSILWNGGTLDYPSKTALRVMAATITEGTKHMSGAEMADFIDFCGARIAGDASSHFTSIQMASINSRFCELLPLIGGMASVADFPENAVEATAKRMSAQRALQFEKVSWRASHQFCNLMRGLGHPASKTTLPSDYESVDRDMVLSAYDIFCKSPFHIFVGGAVDAKMVNEISLTFGKATPIQILPINIIPYQPEDPSRTHIDMPDAKQSAVTMGMPAISRSHPDYIPLRLAIIGLGGYFGSRLMANIREEKGLTYNISASLSGTHEGAYIEIDAQCDAKYVDKVIEETIKEIRNLRHNPPRGNELERLRLHAWSSLATAADSAFGTLEHYITHLRVGTPEGYFENQLQAIASLSPETIARVAEEYLAPEQLTVVTAGSTKC